MNHKNTNCFNELEQETKWLVDGPITLKYLTGEKPTNTCQAPYRLPEGFYDRLEADLFANRLTPEEVAVKLATIIATDHVCGEPAVAIVKHEGRTLHVCGWHAEEHRTLMAPLCSYLDSD